MSNLREYEHTGVIYEPEITINGSDPTKFDLSPFKAVIVDKYTNRFRPTRKIIESNGIVGIPGTYVTSNVGTFLGVNLVSDVLTIQQQIIDFNRTQLDNIVRIGRLGHFGKTVITGTFDFPLNIWTDLDFANFVMQKGTIKLKGLEIQAASTDLSLNRLAGETMRIGAGSTVSTQNFPVSPLSNTISIIPAWRVGGVGADKDNASLGSATTQIDPTHYDDYSGTLALAGNNQYVNLFIYFFPYKAGQTIFQIYGHNEYGTLVAAINGLKEDFFAPIDIKGAIAIAGISVKKEITNLTTAIAGGTAFITLPGTHGEF